MITGALKSQVDQLWLEFHSGGITNPLTVIEQISYLMFARMLDINELKNEKRASRLNKDLGDERIFKKSQQHLRWQNFSQLPAREMLDVVKNEVFPFFQKEMAKKSNIGAFLKDAQFMIQKQSLLASAVAKIQELPLADRDTKGDLYEYLLSKLTTAGINGQFRSPRHVIRAMVEMVAPKPDQAICDPSCGTAGFLVSTMEYLIETYSSKNLIHTEKDIDDNEITIYPGDKLEPYKDNIQNGLLTGFDFDSTMLRIAAMNLLLHGIDSPNIQYQDTLAGSFQDHWPKFATGAFDVILANPPFKGTIDEENVDPTLKGKVKTKKTELLFLVLMLRMLKTGGKCAVIVPEGVLFGSSNAHVAVRKMLVEENQLEGVISLPSGVFKPYAGVSTAILIFTKGGDTKDVWFYDVRQDGYSLDDKRTQLLPDDKMGASPRGKLSEEEHTKNNLPDLIARWNRRDKDEKKRKRTEQSFFVPKTHIVEQGYDLSMNRYMETQHVILETQDPHELLSELLILESEIQKGIIDLQEALR
jgi:type I restriction enzyme M protein